VSAKNIWKAVLDLCQDQLPVVDRILFETKIKHMAKFIETEILIQASTKVVWDILMDFASYPSWNPFVREIEGNPEPGKKIKVRITPPGKKGMVFRPIVLEHQTQKKFRWKGSLLVKGMFDGEHYFELEQVDDSTTRFIHGECFSGMLVKLLWKSLESPTKEGFRAFNEALKKKAENPDEPHEINR